VYYINICLVTLFSESFLLLRAVEDLTMVPLLLGLRAAYCKRKALAEKF